MTPRDPLERDVVPGDADAGHRALREALAALARADADLEAPAHVGQAVLRAWDRRHASPSRRVRRSIAVALAMAAALAVGIAATLSRSLAPPARSSTAVAATDVTLPAAVDPVPDAVSAPASVPAVSPTASRPSRPQPAATRPATGRPPTTVVLVGSPITPGEPVHLVRVRIARETLREMGLRPIAAGGNGPVDVEMLVGEDGVARGLRVSM